MPLLLHLGPIIVQLTHPDVSASTTAPATTTDWAEQSMEEENNNDNNNAEGQTDGASEFQLGSTGLLEPEFDVNVTLSDQQANPNDPLYSIKSFGDLNL